MTYRIGRILSVVCALLVASAVFSFGQDAPPLPVTHQRFNFMDALQTAGEGAAGESIYKNSPSPICTTIESGALNVNTDCEGNVPHNETSIAANPTNALNQIGSANDYQLRTSAGGTVVETSYSRAHVTLDGGVTWTEYPIGYNGYAATGDPGVAFDASGRAYLSTLGFVWSQGNGCCTAPDILVAHSTDGGKTWSSPSRVGSGTGSSHGAGTFNDKPYITAWGSSNAIETWTVFSQGPHGSYISSVIYDSVTHDGGETWSPPQPISGSASFCVGAQGGTACDQDQGSQPVVAADGSIYVSFLSTAEVTTYRDQYLVVKVDPATGARIAGPFRVGLVYDGIYDYPIAFGRQTYQDSLFRTWALGAIATDPTDPQHLGIAWSDMRNSIPLASLDPYKTATNSDIIVSQSSDGGATWSTPIALTITNDQFMPWAKYDAAGLLRIGFFDRSYDPGNHQYGYTLATETAPSSLAFATTEVTTTLSNPTTGDRWFAATANPSFPYATTFLGDYSNINVAGDGSVLSYWTDLRNTVCFGTLCGYGEDAYYASSH